MDVAGSTLAVLGLSLAWGLTLIALLLFFVGVYLVPQHVVRLNSMPWAFHLRRNLDLDLQSVVYATYHRGFLSQFSHWTIGIEQVAWFVVLGSWHPALPLVAWALLAAQAVAIGEHPLSLGIVCVWAGVYALATLATAWLGADLAEVGSIAVLIGCALWRTAGHGLEPVPPLIAERSDRFVPGGARRVGLRMLVVLPVGYLSEFASALPFRLFVVQISWAAQALGYRPRRAMPWRESRQIAAEIHQRGWRAYPPVAALVAPLLPKEYGHSLKEANP